MTKIEWTDLSWNPIAGCTVHSPGCTNCYAMKLAGTRLRGHPLYEGLTDQTKKGPVFNGVMRVADDDNPVWSMPMRSLKTFHKKHGRRPRIFVGDMSDLFHENRHLEDIDRVFAIMALSPHIDFQVLTKRTDVMLRYLTERKDHLDMLVGAFTPGSLPISRHEIEARLSPGASPQQRSHYRVDAPPPWPLPNVWLGASVENQAAAEKRVSELLAAPAALRFLSVEPLIGPVNLRRIKLMEGDGVGKWKGYKLNFNLDGLMGAKSLGWRGVDWVIVGGESGKDYDPRPMHPLWVRRIRDDCFVTGTPFFFKQWGHWHSGKLHEPGQFKECSKTLAMDVKGRVEYAPGEALGRIHEQGWEPICPIGKKNAGAVFDGAEYREFPTSPMQGQV